MKDSFFDLERHRLRLEENILQLKKALKHWQTYEAEYEGLKEEILAFHGDPQPDDLITIGKNFGGTVIAEKEIKELLGDDQNARRNATQVVNVLSRRIEYVQKNANTVDKQLRIAEDKLNSILVISKPDIRNEEGLPIMEIREELDEEGNVISSSATAPNDTTPQTIEALLKTGVTDLGAARHTGTKQIGNNKSERSQTNDQKKQFHVAEDAEVVRESPKPLRPNSTGTVSQDPKPSPSRKKRVAFVEDVKKEERQRFSGHQGRESASKQPAVPRYSGRITELTEDEEEHSSPVVPIDESPEDVALRREMLKYTFSDVGAVVAELDLDEDSQYSYSDDCDEDQETSSVEGEEDMFGRTTRRVVSDKYREEMEALERKLNARAMENVGPRPNELPLSGVAEDLKQLPALRNASTRTKPDESKKPAKRGVRFAEELDIVPAPQNTTTGAPETGGLLPPLEGPVFEQGSITGSRTEPSPPTTRRVSKFKSSRSPAAEQPSNSPILQESANVRGSLAKGPLKEGVIERSLSGVGPSLPLVPSVAAKNGYQFSSPAVPHEETRAAPEGPSGKVLSDSIIERSTADYSTGPPDPDGLDPALLRQEIAMEYHHMRNRMIQREGGFMPREEELERVPLTVEEGGSGRKVSRFKAARLGKRVGP